MAKLSDLGGYTSNSGNKFNLKTGTNNAGNKWELYQLPSGTFANAGIWKWSDGSYYYGKMTSTGARTFGLYYWPNGESCMGSLNNSVRDGLNLYIFAKNPSSISYYLGYYKDGKRSGRGIELYSDGSWRCNQYSDGKKHGKGLYFNASTGYAKYENYSNGVEISSVELPHYFSFSSKLAYLSLRSYPHTGYSMQYVDRNNNNNVRYQFNGQTSSNGTWHGLGVIEWLGSEYNSYMGEFKNGNKTVGLWIKKAWTYFGELVDNYFNGTGLYYYNDGAVYFGGWRNGKRHGMGFYLYSNGDIAYGQYNDGKISGPTVYIYNSFTIADEKFNENNYVSNSYKYIPSTSTTTTSTTTKSTTTTSTTTTKSTTTTTPIKKSEPKRKLTFKELGIDNPYDLYNDLIGLTTVKYSFDDIIDEIKNNSKKHNMIFIGNPGSGKTHLANIYAGILYDNNLSDKASIVELDIEAALKGSKGTNDIKNAFKNAKNSAIIIDNIACLAGYSAYNKNDIQTIKDELLNSIKSSDTSIIYTCYNSEVNELESIIYDYIKGVDYKLDFDEYKEDDYREMAEYYIKKNNYTVDEEALDDIVDKIERNRRYRSFKGAKDLMSLLDQVFENCKKRCDDEFDKDDDEYGLIISEDVVRIFI